MEISRLQGIQWVVRIWWRLFRPPSVQGSQHPSTSEVTRLYLWARGGASCSQCRTFSNRHFTRQQRFLQTWDGRKAGGNPYGGAGEIERVQYVYLYFQLQVWYGVVNVVFHLQMNMSLHTRLYDPALLPIYTRLPMWRIGFYTGTKERYSQLKLSTSNTLTI